MLSFRIPPEIFRAVKRAAKAEDRSRSSWCLRALRERLIRQGHLPTPEGPGLADMGVVSGPDGEPVRAPARRPNRREED